MNKIKFLITTLLLTFVILHSCKKDEEIPVNKNGKTEYTQHDKAQELLKKIHSFQEMRDAYRNGVKNNETMTLAEAREILDLSINYEHSEHEKVCYETTLDTLTIPMLRTDNSGNVSVNDVVETYNTFETTLANHINAIEDDMNVSSYFSIKFPENNSKDNNIEIIFTRGIETDEITSLSCPPEGPFAEGDNYYWGIVYGRCDAVLSERTNAAMELSKQFKYIPNPPCENCIMALCNVEYVSYAAYDYNYDDNDTPPLVYYNNPRLCDGNWLFVAYGEYETEPCIPYDEMNFYWRNIRNFIVRNNAPLHYSPVYHSPYHECTVIAKHCFKPEGGNSEENETKRSVRIHYVTVTYCDVLWDNQTPVQ